MKVRTHERALTKLRRGVLELYVSEHPDGQLPRQQPLRARDISPHEHGIGESRFAGAATHARPAHAEAGRRQQSVFPLRQRPVHRLLALRARLRRHAGNVRADDRRPRLRIAGRRVAAAAVPRIRVRVLRRLRRGLPDRRADGEVGHHRGLAAAGGHHHLRVLRRRLFADRRGHATARCRAWCRTATAARTRATPA